MAQSNVCLDFFNPLENKQGGKKASVGIISVVCLSLLGSHRYQFENMFLAGIIPGPKEPPLTTIRHYFTPLVDQFLALWNPGIYFSRTYNFPQGRLILAALILVVCDLLAARKLAGFASPTSNHFCSVEMYKQKKGKDKEKTCFLHYNHNLKLSGQFPVGTK